MASLSLEQSQLRPRDSECAERPATLAVEQWQIHPPIPQAEATTARGQAHASSGPFLSAATAEPSTWRSFRSASSSSSSSLSSRGLGLWAWTLDMRLSDVSASLQGLVPLLSMPLWLPFTLMLSALSYVFTSLIQAAEASDGGEGPWNRQVGGSHRGAGVVKLQGLGRVPSTGSMATLRGSTGGGSRSGTSILRALDQVLELVTALPSSSPKYSFARSLAEQLLQDNTAQKPPLLVLNRAALSKALRRTVAALELCLTRGGSSSASWQSILRRCTKATGLATALGSCPQDAPDTPSTLRTEKLSQELAWLTDRLFEYGGGPEAVRLWANAPALADAAAANASPRVQGNLVRLSAVLVRAMTGCSWAAPSSGASYSSDALSRASPSLTPYSGAASLGTLLPGSGASTAPPAVAPSQPLAPLDVQFRLLLLWLPLMCRAAHAGDGPVLTTAEKQRTEEALQHTILELAHSEQEMLFSSWLHEYSWSSSDWPNLQPQYVAWCERARRVAHVSVSDFD